MKRNNYMWQGKPCKVSFGFCIVRENIEKPLYWYNFECNFDTYLQKPIHDTIKEGILIAIKVTQDDYSFCIANHYGIGIHKLINGGWPNYRHFSAPIESFKEASSKEESYAYRITKFDLEGFELYESQRTNWFKRNHPEEYQKLEMLKKSFKTTKA